MWRWNDHHLGGVRRPASGRVPLMRRTTGRRTDNHFDRPSLAVDFKRRHLVWALVRSLVSATLLVTVYFVLPLDRSLDASGVALLLLGLVVFGITVAWQVRAILQAQYPALQAIEALAIAIPLFLLTFSAVYIELARGTGRAFTEPLNKVDAVYFTVTVFATVGFGDIAPVTQAARIITTVQMLGDLVVLGVLIKTIAGAVKLTRDHRSASSADTEAAQPAAVPSQASPAVDVSAVGTEPPPAPGAA